MLILTRKKEEEIKIGDEITVRVLGIQFLFIISGSDILSRIRQIRHKSSKVNRSSQRRNLQKNTK